MQTLCRSYKVKPTLIELSRKLPIYAALFGVAFVIAIQMPAMLPQLTQLGGSPYIWVFWTPLAISIFSLVVWMINESSLDGHDMAFVGLIGTFVLLGVFFAGGFIARTPFNQVGMYNILRLSHVKDMVNEMDRVNPEARLAPENRIFIQAVSRPTPGTVNAAYQIQRNLVKGKDYNRFMSSAALLGMTDRDAYQNGLKNGWLRQSEIDDVARELRQSPPASKDMNATHAAAFQYLLGAGEG